MIYNFAKSCVGYAHLKNNLPCQDYSSTYVDPSRAIITCCDGHGGARYVRSQRGSAFASAALLEVFQAVSFSRLSLKAGEGLANAIKLNLLCAYNRRVEEDLSAHPLRKKELERLSEDEREDLRDNPARAYGTTLTGAMAYQGKIILVSIGDTEALLFRHGELIHPFDTEEDPAGNLTYSMCQEDAYAHLRVAIVEEKSVDGVLLCTDGLSAPYQSYANLTSSFLRPAVEKALRTHSIASLERFVEDVALTRGVGDDVSLAMLLHDDASLRFYFERRKP